MEKRIPYRTVPLSWFRRVPHVPRGPRRKASPTSASIVAEDRCRSAFEPACVRSPVFRDHGGGLHLDLGILLDKCRDLDHGHRRKMVPHHLAVDPPHALEIGLVLPAIGDVPGHTDDVLGTGPCLGQHRQGVAQALAHLASKVAGPKDFVLLPADLTGDEHQSPLGGHAVGVAFWPRPPRWLEFLHLGPFWAHAGLRTRSLALRSAL